ncbi:MAG TPA: metal ABC transporter substrate-binding protein [Acidimicrobiales bacterium]
MTLNVGSLVAAAMTVLLLSGCSGGTNQPASGSTGAPRPVVVVSDSVLGDVVRHVVGDAADVSTIIPVGADAHEFQISARELSHVEGADAVIVTGVGFTEGLNDVIEALRGGSVPVFDASSALRDPLPAGGVDDDGYDDDDGHDDGVGIDLHYFMDPSRMAQVVDGIVDFLSGSVEEIDVDRMRATVTDYLAELSALELEIEQMLAGIPPTDRALVTDHNVLGYFADRYDFDIAGIVNPGGSHGGTSARDLAALTELIRRRDLPAMFITTSAPGELVETVASEVGDVSVVPLFTESLGPAGSGAETYVEMMRTNARRIVAALG